MPFNGGIGMHDAYWRSSFGGRIYKTNGSHGCINLPPAVAKTIYENISAGMPVLCYHLDGSGAAMTSTTAQNGGAASETKPQQTQPAQTESETKPQPTTAAQPQPTTAAQPQPITAAQPQPTTAAQPQPTTAAQPASPADIRTVPGSAQAYPGQNSSGQNASSGSSSSGGPGSGSNGTQSSPGGPGSIRLWREQFTWSIPDTGAGKLSRNGAVKKISN